MDKLSLIKSPIESEYALFQEKFSAALDSGNPLLNAALQHIQKAAGKLMRPILTLLSAKVFGTPNDKTYNSAISLEMLHNASLVHDDVIDESDTRRGQPSIKALFNNTAAVLIGDYLLSTSLKYISYIDTRSVGVMSDVAQQLAAGELLQMNNIQTSSFSEESYFEMIGQKTASLFTACGELGALSMNATETDVQAMRRFTEIIGVVFQIRDDVFDYFTSDVGKPTGNDLKEGKLTLPALYVVNHCNDDEIIEIAHDIRTLDASPEQIEMFSEYVKTHGGIEYAEETMQRMCQEAEDYIPKTAPNEVRQALLAYLDFVVQRTK